MKRILLGAAACALTLASAQAQMGQPQPGEDPSVAHAIPLSYVGGSGRVSLGIDSDGNSQGEALGIFGNNGEHAYIGQIWWGNGGSGGVQLGYNWLWGGVTQSQALEHPERVTVARTMVAIDQNMFKDRKATIGFGIERKNYFIDAYLSAAASGSRNGGTRSSAVDSVLDGSDPIGAYTQVETLTTTEGFASSAYDSGLGLRIGHFSDALALRLYGGMDYQGGRAGAHVFTLSAGADKYLGHRGWSMSGLVEHDESSTDPLLGGSSDTRASLYLRYEFGGRVFAPTSELTSPAWISRALANPPTGHPRVVQTYTRRTSTTTTTQLGAKHYTNHNPIAVDDAATVVADAVATRIDVLANDSDADGDPLMIASVTPALHGSASIDGSQIGYTPAAGYVGADRFSYTISDGRGGSAAANVTITVAPQPNRPPVARDDAASTQAGRPVTIDVLANDADPDGDPLSVTSVTQPAHGGAALGADGRITYTPDVSFTGTDRFAYTIGDGHGGSARADVTITVAPQPNRPPIARDDQASAQGGTPVTIDVLSNDSDPDGDPLSVTAVTQGQHGSVTILPDSRIGYAWTDVAANGTDRFTYTIGDGHGGSASATVTITQASAPNRPPVANDDSATVSYQGSVTVDVLSNDSDPDGDPLSVTAVTQGQHGSVTILPDNRVGYAWTDMAANGIDHFTYTIDDGRGGSASATVTITQASAPNRPPVANDDSATVPYQGSVTVDVLANDSDPDGDPLSVTAVTQGQHGSVTILPDNRVGYAWTDMAANGIDHFTYTIDDGRGGSASATVTITQASAPNRPPVANDDSATVPYQGSVTVDVLANDSDPDGDPLSVTAVTQGQHGSVTILPDNRVGYAWTDMAANGIDHFTYTIDDGRGGSASATVTITQASAPNRPPVANDDSATVPYQGSVTVDVLSNDSDPDGDPLSVTAVTQGQHGSVTILPDNRVGYAWTDAAPDGIDHFTYTIDDGRGGSASATVTITQAPAPNHPPVANDDSAAMLHDGGVLTIPVLDNDSDPDGDPLTVISVSQPSFGDVTILADGVLAYVQHAGSVSVSDSFTYTISDGRGGTASATVTVLPPPNQPPIAVDDEATAYMTADVNFIDVLANDSDPDGDKLRILSVTQPAAGTVSIAGDRVLYIPTDIGHFTFSYTIGDGHGGIASATVTVDVEYTP